MKRSNDLARRERATRSLFRLSPVAAGATAMLLGMGTASAQTSGPSTQPAAAAGATETIVITGIRRGIENAINVKKNNDSIVEAISAEDIGKLPDSSVAESIARLPGLAAQRTRGRAQGINARGFSSDFAGTTLNGREQVTTGDSRGVEFDAYPSELLSGVLIYKTPDAALMGQGLSATIDMQTIRPLDVSGRQMAVNYRKQRTGVGLSGEEGGGYRFSLSYVDQFMDRKLGVALGFARLDDSGAQTSRFEAWGVADSQVNGAGPTVRTPGGFNAFLDQEKPKRDGAMAVVQFRPNKDFNSTLDLFWGKFEKSKTTQGFQAPIGFSSAGGYDPGGTLTTATVAGGIATSGTFNNFKGVMRMDEEFIEDKLTSLGWKNQLKFGKDWTGTLDLSHSKNTRTGGIVESTAGLPGNGNAGGQVDTISWTGFDGNNVGGANYTTGLDYTNRNLMRLTDVQGWGGGVTLPQAGYSKLPFVEDKLNAFRLSAKKDLGDSGFFSAADFGINLTDRKKERSYTEGRIVIAGSVDLTNGTVIDPFASAPIPGSSTIVAQGIPLASWKPGALLGSVYDVVPKFVRDIANKDWRVAEKVTTAYTKWDIDSKIGALPVRGNIGVQLVHTDQSSTAFNIDGAPCPADVCSATEVKGGTTYSDVLPSANFAFDLGSDQTLRFGLARVLARAKLNDMRASFGFGVDSASGVSILKGGAGNPELKPYRANAVDISYEKYFGSKAYFSAAFFHKHLTSYIVEVEQPFDFGPLVTPGVTPLPATGPFAGSTLGLLKQPLNGKGGSVTGLEVAASFPLNMLHKSLDGFGVFGNYANTDSSVSLPTSGFNSNNEITTPNIPLPGLSKEVYSFGAYFEKRGFSARIAQRSRSDFVGDVTNIFGDRSVTYVKAERVVDYQIGYEFQSGPARGLSLLFQVSNANDAPFIRYRDTPSNQIENTKYGRTYLFGLNYKL